MKHSGTHAAFDEAFRFAKDPRPYEVKEREYLRKKKEAEPVDLVGMAERILFITK